MQRLTEGARALGLCLTAQQQASFQVYYEELVAWNQRFNLTAVTGYEEVQVRHFLDSLSCLAAGEIRGALSRAGSRAIDIGSGAGLPGIPLKIVSPAFGLTLLEATGKKVTFLQHLVRRLGLAEVTAIHARAEELGHEPGHREAYDVALARAVAELPVVVEYALPFCRVGGWVVAQKGSSGPEEAQAAQNALDQLGGMLHRVVPVELPEVPENRYLVVLRKVRPIPSAYPRRPGMPGKRPL